MELGLGGGVSCRKYSLDGIILCMIGGSKLSPREFIQPGANHRPPTVGI